MSTLLLYHTALVAHILGLSMMGGATLVEYVSFRQFWKILSLQKQSAPGIQEIIARFSPLIRIGIALLVISGLGMMVLTRGVFGEQLWFRIKFALVIIIIINIVFVRRRLGSQLRQQLALDTSGDNVDGFLMIKRNLRMFHIAQLSLFLIIFILSVFKMN